MFRRQSVLGQTLTCGTDDEKKELAETEHVEGCVDFFEYRTVRKRNNEISIDDSGLNNAMLVHVHGVCKSLKEGPNGVLIVGVKISDQEGTAE